MYPVHVTANARLHSKAWRSVSTFCNVQANYCYFSARFFSTWTDHAWLGLLARVGFHCVAGRQTIRYPTSLYFKFSTISGWLPCFFVCNVCQPYHELTPSKQLFVLNIGIFVNWTFNCLPLFDMMKRKLIWSSQQSLLLCRSDVWLSLIYTNWS